MGLYMQMEQRLRQCQAMECSVCKQLIDDKSVLEGRKLKQVQVITGWASCPCCTQEVEAPFTDAYKRRFVRWCVEHGIKPGNKSEDQKS
jgi:uncharacterized protein (UPF0212 family)